MTCPLIPERPILVSPSLAATIGLEECGMLSVLHEQTSPVRGVSSQGREWYELDAETLQEAMPFWSDQDLQRVSQSLRASGILHLQSAPFCQSQHLVFAFEGADGKLSERPQARAHEAVPGAHLMAPGWQPDRYTIARITQHNIPEHFIVEQIPEFVTFWRESGEAHRAWGARFHSHVVHQWRQRETFTARKERESTVNSDWRPSQDAVDVLVRQAGINARFVEDAIPEFVLYWSERGEKSRTWNSKFIQHTRRQWIRYTSALEHDTEPHRIPPDWQPGQDVLDVLAMANIDIEFARQLVPEFVIFWRDTNQLHNSWNTKFLQHAKHHWAKRHAYQLPQGQNNEGHQAIAQPGRTRDRTLAEDLNDRSWAG